MIPNLKKKKAGTLKFFLEYVSKKSKRPHLPVIDMEVKTSFSIRAIAFRSGRDVSQKKQH